MFSPGGIDEQVGDPTLADSFFDVFFEIQVGGLTLHNNLAEVVEAVIREIPPIGSTYIAPQAVALFDENDDQVGVLLAGVSHTPTPEASAFVCWSIIFGGCGTYGLRRRRKKAA